MKSLLTFFAFTLCGTLAANASVIVNANAICSDGTTINLNAGTYEVNVIGTNQGGQYNGWDFASQNFGTNSATPAPGDWVDSFDITMNGNTTSYVATGNPTYNSASAALAGYQSSILEVNSQTPASTKFDTATFTLTSNESVNFKVADYLFVDNWGGVSLKVSQICPTSATPEPASFGLMGLALVAVGVYSRKFIR